jgi:hypothetical protein
MRCPIIIKLEKADLYGFLTDVPLPKGALLKMNGVLYEALNCKKMNTGFKVDLKIKDNHEIRSNSNQKRVNSEVG